MIMIDMTGIKQLSRKARIEKEGLHATIFIAMVAGVLAVFVWVCK